MSSLHKFFRWKDVFSVFGAKPAPTAAQLDMDIKAWKIRKEKTNSGNQHIGYNRASIQKDYICTISYAIIYPNGIWQFS